MTIYSAIAACAACCSILAGCASSPTDVFLAPEPLLAPYDTRAGEVTWAVVPPLNESGTTSVDELTVGDALVTSIEEVRGVRCIPMNRTVQAMRDLKIHSIATAADARQLATHLGADAIVVTALTSYDPYVPQVGIAAAIYARPGAMAPQQVHANGDPRLFSRQVVDLGASQQPTFGERPVCTISENFDGRNHQVQADLMTYSVGRQRDESAMGWRRYLASMPLFVQFASYRTVATILQQEWIRMGTGPVQTDKDSKEQRRAAVGKGQVVGQQVDTIQRTEKNKVRITKVTTEDETTMK
jgi:hypothetical protein